MHRFDKHVELEIETKNFNDAYCIFYILHILYFMMHIVYLTGAYCILMHIDQ